MKNILFSFFWFVLLCVACNDEQAEGLWSGEPEGVVFRVADFEEESGTRVSVLVDATGTYSSWTEGDTLGVFPMNGYQTAFPISAGNGTNSALFDGADWALRPKARYAAYFPFVYENKDRSNIRVSYIGQTQKFDASTSHIGVYDFLASQFTQTGSTGRVNFELNHLGALVRFRMTMPEPDFYTSLTLSCDEAIFATEGTFDLTADTPTLTGKKKQKSITLNLDSIETTEPNQLLTFYMMLPPADWDGKVITLSVKGDQRYELKIPGRVLKAGKIYGYTGTMTLPLLKVDDKSVEFITYQKPGSDSDNIVWVFTGDGFTEEDMTTFNAKIQTSIARFLSKEPYKQFRDKINIYIARVKSANSYGFGETVYGSSKVGDRLAKLSETGEAFRDQLMEAIEGTVLDSKDYYLANPSLSRRRIKAFQILVNSWDYFGMGTLYGTTSIYSLGSFSMDIDLHEMGHTHGLVDEYPGYSYNGINVAAERTVEDVPWKSFVGYRGVGAFQYWDYPRCKPTNNCLMYNDGDYCAVCQAYVFRQLNMSLAASKRLALYDGGIETTIVQDSESVMDGSSPSQDGYYDYKDVHQLSNYKTDSINSTNLYRADGERLEARTMVINFLSVPKLCTINLEILNAAGARKSIFSKTYSLPAYDASANYNTLPQSLSVRTPILSLDEGDQVKTYLNYGY